MAQSTTGNGNNSRFDVEKLTCFPILDLPARTENPSLSYSRSMYIIVKPSPDAPDHNECSLLREDLIGSESPFPPLLGFTFNRSVDNHFFPSKVAELSWGSSRHWIGFGDQERDQYCKPIFHQSPIPTE
jgi:hypothetical protein